MSSKGHASGLYLDTSCLLKLSFREPESQRVAETLAAERSVLVSELAWLEAETQLRGRWLGGLLSKAKHQRLAAELSRMLTLDPFEVVALPEDAFVRARNLVARASVHCRTLDVLHVAVMDALGIERLFTNDTGQAALAKALGFSVTLARSAG